MRRAKTKNNLSKDTRVGRFIAVYSVLACVIVASIFVFSACRQKSGDYTAITADSSLSDASTQTHPETTKAPAVPVAKKHRVYAEELGLSAYRVFSSDNSVAMAESLGGGIMIYTMTSGEVSFAIEDCFGHTASVDLKISEAGELDVKVNKTEDKFVEVKTHYGAKGNGITDDTAAIQRAIDDAKPGDTVYVYPGIYNVSLLVMREGVTLEMFTTMKDAREGLSGKLAQDITQGNITVLSGVRIMNNENNQPGAEGASNFTIRGGVLDMKKTTRGAIIFGCADNALLENVILKDVKNNHAVQLTGCTNTTIRNCMFAGYEWGGTFTREVVQVEASHPGATGTPPSSPLTFQEGEFYYCENIEITGCYFGESDKSGAPLISIGHHSKNGKATVTGFKITNNVFDEVMYAAIRHSNIVDTEISGNTFISTSKYMSVDHADAKNPAFIIIYSDSGATTYNNIITGEKVTRANAHEQAGTHNLLIKDNTFTVGAGSDKIIIHITGTVNTEGLIYVDKQLRQHSYNSRPYYYSGYTVCTNVVSGVTVTGNTIRFEGQPKYDKHFMYFLYVYDLVIENNNYEFAQGVSFYQSSGGVIGLLTGSIKNGEAAKTKIIQSNKSSNNTITLTGDVLPITLTTSKENNFNIPISSSDGGKIVVSVDEKGNGIVTPVADDGYLFDGWYIKESASDQNYIRISEQNIELDATKRYITAKFIKAVKPQ